MAEVNLLTPSSIKGKTIAFKAAANLSTITIISNPADSGKTLKINELSVFYDNDTAAGYILINGIKFDKISNTGSRSKVINKEERIYLEQGGSITYALATGSGMEINFFVSYEEIS
jgi:hypothetical protein